ncbi:MAG: HAMP domain-containing histidine kinase [Candidatus Eremiobacteraeota bacterium]|nr:HAMP domain-containing histidine kinase [Candidatus Eremiobacteraeota bacterium]
MLAVIVLLVIIASSFVLVSKLSALTGDVLIAKHEEARILVDQYREQGVSLKQAAPQIVDQLSGIGLSIAVFDSNGKFLAGDNSLHPRFLPRGGMPPPMLRHDANAAQRFMAREIFSRPSGPHREPIGLAMVSGGFVAFSPSWGLIWVALLPYWKIIVTIAVVAVALAWLLGWYFSKQALRPLQSVADALHALAGGQYTQQRFALAEGEEMASLTSAYNEAAANVAASMEERRRTEERMRQFVADAGHELRTPLTVIAGYIDVLRRGAVAEPNVAKQILNTMAIEKEHMRSLIDRLMRLARLDTETPPHKETIDVAELLRSQCEAARRLDNERQISYSVDGASEITGDRAEIGEALWNVVENALKYAPGAPIHLRANRDNGKTAIMVQDDGPGMTESERLHAFERFYRGDERGEITGTGLGLAIAKRAVDRAGGDIRIDSAPGHGTTVTIKI